MLNVKIKVTILKVDNKEYQITYLRDTHKRKRYMLSDINNNTTQLLFKSEYNALLSRGELEELYI